MGELSGGKEGREERQGKEETEKKVREGGKEGK